MCLQAEVSAAVSLAVEEPFDVRATCTAAARCCAYIPSDMVRALAAESACPCNYHQDFSSFGVRIATRRCFK